MRRLVVLLLALVAAGSLAGPVAQAATPRTSYYAVESKVMCVTCNVPLGVATSAQAMRQKDEIRLLVSQGLTTQQVLDRLVGEYGDNVLADPPASGVSLFAYLVPVLAIVLLVGLGLVLLPRWRRTTRARIASAGPAADGPALSDADARRLDEDLGRFRL